MPDTKRIFGAHGVTYSNAFVTTPMCCPSRSSILTGQYAHNHGVKSNLIPLDQSKTLESYLSRAGYRTGLYGKFLNSWPLDQNPPYWDRWRFFNRVHFDVYDGGDWNANGWVRPVSAYPTHYIARGAVHFLADAEGHDRQPWFLYLAPPNPHLPAIPEDKYADAPIPPATIDPSMPERDRSDKPQYIQDATTTVREGKELRARQLRALMSADDMVQRVFHALSTYRETRRTLAIFISDNGLLWAEHGWDEKSVPYTSSIKVPMFARWPGHLAPRTHDRRLVANIDIAPTVLEAAGITPDPAKPIDGRSLLSSGRRGHILAEFWKLHKYPVPTWASIRTRSFQYVEYYGDDGQTVIFREYYDLRADPYQLDNRLGDADRGNDPDVSALHDRLAKDRTCVGVACP